MKEFLNNQYKNLFLWAPFVMAFGAALYFSCGTEPNFSFPILITVLLGLIIYKKQNVFIRGLAIFLFGFFYAMSFTHIIDTPQIKDSFGEIQISGKIKDIDYTTDKTRLLVKIPSEQINKEIHNNINVRISISDDNNDINIGDTITGNAILFHPSSKYAPASFDFARWAYFSKISGTGFFKDYQIIKSEAGVNIRNFIHNKSNSFLTDSLVLGYKKTLPEHDSNLWKSVGIGHVWSISGFHMTLVGGWLFAIFYLIFRTIPKITKRIPAKYPALICAWFGLLFYLFMSGINVATVRAFLMATLIGIATLFGRGVLSLRNAALAFLVIFLINPFSIMNAGFQLSFSAIFGLLWFFDNKEDYIKRTFIQRQIHFLYLSLMTAIIATIFTLPFIVAHFGYIPLYGLIGNIILLPIFSIAIMPLIIIGTICALFNYHLLINISHNIYQFALFLAEHITNMPYANIQMPHVSNSVLLSIIFGLLCLILIVKPDSKNHFVKNINYYFCAIFIIFGIIIYITTPRPMFYATEDHQLVAFNVDNKLQFNHAKMSKHYFAFDSWYEFNNEKIPDKNKRYKCDHGFCRFDTNKWNLIYMQNFTTIMNNINTVCEDKSIDYIVTTFDIKAPNCRAKILHDGLLIYQNGKIVNIINHRPWHNQH